MTIALSALRAPRPRAPPVAGADVSRVVPGGRSGCGAAAGGCAPAVRSARPLPLLHPSLSSPRSWAPRRRAAHPRGDEPVPRIPSLTRGHSRALSKTSRRRRLGDHHALCRLPAPTPPLPPSTTPRSRWRASGPAAVFSSTRRRCGAQRPPRGERRGATSRRLVVARRSHRSASARTSLDSSGCARCRCCRGAFYRGRARAARQRVIAFAHREDRRRAVQALISGRPCWRQRGAARPAARPRRARQLAAVCGPPRRRPPV